MRAAIHALAFALLSAAVVATVMWARHRAGIADGGPTPPPFAAPPFPDAPRLSGLADLAFAQGRSAWERGRYGDAAVLFGRAAAGKPDDPALRFLLGASYLMEGLAEPARQQLRRAADLDPGDACTLYYLGEAEALAGDREAARRAFEAASAVPGPWAEAARRALSRP